MRKNILCASVLVLALANGYAYAEPNAHWGYGEKNGPDTWAQLSPDFASCNGKNQSPVNLTGFIDAELKPLNVSYNAGGSEVLNNGHAIQVTYNPGSLLTLEGSQFQLTQFHFHAPSENQINGKSYPMEAHLVHTDKDGNLAVIALLFEEGKENPALSNIWSNMPQEPDNKTTLPALFNVQQLLPASLEYYRFNGSLTTPPCTEGVRWVVLKNPVTVSKDQLKSFAQTMRHPNNRTTQPINARPILE